MKIIITIVGLLVAWFLFWQLPVNGIHLNTGDGGHTGFITAVERNGIIWKTYTAYIKTDVSSSQEDLYCVIDTKVIEQLKEKAKNKEKVTIEYISWLGAGMRYCNAESAIITGLKD